MGDSEADIKLAKAFARRAGLDLKSAKVLLDAGIYADSVYHAQQSVEKIVKALLILENKFVRTHFVSSIFERVIRKFEEKWRKRLEELIPIIVRLEENWVLPRYPEPFGEEIWDPLKEYTKDYAEKAIKDAEHVLKTLKEFVKEVYNIEL